MAMARDQRSDGGGGGGEEAKGETDATIAVEALVEDAAAVAAVPYCRPLSQRCSDRGRPAMPPPP